MQDPISFVGYGRTGIVGSLVVVYGMYGLVAGGFVAFALARVATHLRRAAAARASMEGAIGSSARPAPLVEGHAVVTGRVELEPGETVAVRLRIEQRGTESSSRGHTSYAWSEVRRQVTARPFVLLLASGERVHVEPTEDVMLVDRLDSFERITHTERIRGAELTVGERVTAVGVLRRQSDASAAGAGYRTAGTSFVLTPPPGERMLLSTEPLTMRHASWARFYAGAAAIVTTGLLLLHAFVFADFHGLVWGGKVAWGHVTSLTSFTTPGKKHPISHYVVHADLPGVGDVFDETSQHAFQTLAKGSRVPFLVRGNVRQIGTEPGISDAAGAFPGWAFLGAVGLTVYAWRERRVWYEKKKVVEGGSGPLV